MSPRSTGWVSRTVARTDRAPRSPSHSDVPTRGRKSKSGYFWPSRVSSISVRWETQIVQRPEPEWSSLSTPAATTSFISRSTSLRCEVPWDLGASGRCSATPSTRTPPRRLSSRGRLAQAGCAEAVAAHRGHPLEDHPRLLAGSGAVLDERGQVVEPADGVDHPGVIGCRVERPPRGEHEQRPVVPLLDVGDLLVGADGEGVHAEPLGLAGQPAEAEAVAVSLGHRHQVRVALVHVLEVGPPAVTVDAEDQCHDAHPRRFM